MKIYEFYHNPKLVERYKVILPHLVYNLVFNMFIGAGLIVSGILGFCYSIYEIANLTSQLF